MDWQQVMARPDWTQAEKANRWAEHCARLGMKPYPETFKAKGKRP